MLLLVVGLAAGLRLYHLGEWPPGPYRDEAYNGLDALGVLRGELALFFPANNGREPLYIYLVALSVALFGSTVFALRLPAALAGALATLPVYLLGRDWFGRTTGLLAAILWAITFWPIHLGRIGLRAGLLAPLLALAFWLGTRAWRERQAGWWLAAGLVYGLSFYSYLAVRFTPLLLGLFALYLIATGRRARLWDSGRVLWFVLGAALAVAPLALVFAAEPSLVFGRAGQVSILSPAINGGDPLGALLANAGRALGMYLWRGDDILRHNAWLTHALPPGQSAAGRPVFDWLMVGPFVAGLAWCLRHWRRPASAFLLLWQLVMLGPTVLAEDAPHFLRAAGALPGAVFFPAIGLALLWQWRRLPASLRRAAVVLLLGGSAALTARSYIDYAQQPDVAYLFESAAADLAHAAAADTQAGLAVYLDRRFPDGWPSVRFLLGDQPAATFTPADGLPALVAPSAVYAWPYDSLDFLPAAIDGAALVEITPGPLARGDLEPEPYSLYTRYAVTPQPASPDPATSVNFDGSFLLDVSASLPAADEVVVDLRWRPDSGYTGDRQPPNVFIHVTGPEGMVAQYDGPLLRGLWPTAGWSPEVQVSERYALRLPRPFNPAGDSVAIGLYWPNTNERLPVLETPGQIADDKVIIRPEP